MPVFGFYFHIRGIQRKPGGWRLPMTNMIMGPPIFAPLLFGTSAYLGLDRLLSAARRCASTRPRRLDEDTVARPASAFARGPRTALSRAGHAGGHDSSGRSQSSPASAPCSAASRPTTRTTKITFATAVQWTPVISRRCWPAAAFASVKSRRLATTALPAMSALAAADAAVGFFYHARGVLRRPGGRKHLLYNIMYGPPIFAPFSSAPPECSACWPACCGEKHK